MDDPDKRRRMDRRGVRLAALGIGEWQSFLDALDQSFPFRCAGRRRGLVPKIAKQVDRRAGFGHDPQRDGKIPSDDALIKVHLNAMVARDQNLRIRIGRHDAGRELAQAGPQNDQDIIGIRPIQWAHVEVGPGTGRHAIIAQ